VTLNPSMPGALTVLCNVCNVPDAHARRAPEYHSPLRNRAIRLGWSKEWHLDGTHVIFPPYVRSAEDILATYRGPRLLPPEKKVSVRGRGRGGSSGGGGRKGARAQGRKGCGDAHVRQDLPRALDHEPARVKDFLRVKYILFMVGSSNTPV